MERSRELLEEWVRKEVLRSIKERDLPIGEEHVPTSLVQGITEEMLVYNPRKLYDFLDENSIFLTIAKEGKSWYYRIDEHLGDGTYYESRSGAEKVGFEKAFKILDDAK